MTMAPSVIILVELPMFIYITSWYSYLTVLATGSIVIVISVENAFRHEDWHKQEEAQRRQRTTAVFVENF